MLQAGRVTGLRAFKTITIEAYFAASASTSRYLRGMSLSHGKYLRILASIFGVWWQILAIHPKDRTDWLLENALAVAGVVVLAVAYRRFSFSRLSYTLIFIFMCLHEVGAHYTYAEVPYDDWFQQIFGRTFNSLVGWQRNNFDRVVHFLYGFLLAYPIREVFLRVVNVRGFGVISCPSTSRCPPR